MKNDMDVLGEKLKAVGVEQWEIFPTRDPGPGQHYYWRLNTFTTINGKPYGGGVSSEDKSLLFQDEVVKMFKLAIEQSRKDANAAGIAQSVEQ